MDFSDKISEESEKHMEGNCNSVFARPLHSLTRESYIWVLSATSCWYICLSTGERQGQEVGVGGGEGIGTFGIVFEM